MPGLALRDFLGLALGDRVPDHSSLAVIGERLPLEVHEGGVVFVLKLVGDRGRFGAGPSAQMPRLWGE
jgi:hypothetical protein